MSSQWKLVPVEPTETMVINGFESVPDECFSDEEVWEQYQEMSGCQQAAFRAKLCWAAMLAAAPMPPQADLDRVTAERDALQLLLNQRDEQIETLKRQPQGEPVAWRWMQAHKNEWEYGTELPICVIGAWAPLYAEQPAPLAFPGYPPVPEDRKFLAPVAAPLDYGSLDAVKRLALCRGEVPAPVAVVLPERLDMTDGLHSYEYVTGHNAAIDKMLGVKS